FKLLIPTESTSNRKSLREFCKSAISSLFFGLVPSIGSTEPKCLKRPSRVVKSNSSITMLLILYHNCKSSRTASILYVLRHLHVCLKRDLLTVCLFVIDVQP